MTKIKVDEKTKLVEIMPLIEGLNFEQIIGEAKKFYNIVDWWQISIDNFCDFCEGDFMALKIDKENLTLFGWAVILDFRSFAENFVDIVGKLVVPMTSEEKGMQEGLPKLTMFEVMAGFVRKWFNCKSYEEAGKYKLSEYLLARTEDYRNKVIEKRIFESQKRKNKIK